MSTDMQGMGRLEEENQKLKEQNELLLKTIIQMKVTLNRLISRYVEEEPMN
ncbi:MAG: hypothetical protein PHV18_09050 [Lachnospiraceae bacterium]|nr:hypothetical protein [Lachnospiraceae bacterium]